MFIITISFRYSELRFIDLSTSERKAQCHKINEGAPLVINLDGWALTSHMPSSKRKKMKSNVR